MSLEAAVAEATGRAVRSLRRVGGGDINDAYAAELEDGGHAFVKTRDDAPAGEYPAEAAGLRWLAVPNGLGVPEVLGVRDEPPRLLALEWLEPGAAGDEAELGRGLAWVHAAGADSSRPSARLVVAAARVFGGAEPHGSARSTLPNDPLPDWPAFYAERRLRPLLGPPATAGRCRRAACGRSRASASGSPSWRGRRSRPRACTATCGAATCSGAAGGRT